MKRSRSAIQTFLLDTNVFIAAVKNPTRQTDTLRLLLKLIRGPNIRKEGLIEVWSIGEAPKRLL
jgi:predicted nucleic acid-binding protein